jgi:hypothetical protein
MEKKERKLAEARNKGEEAVWPRGTPEDDTNRLSCNISKKLPLLTA